MYPELFAVEDLFDESAETSVIMYMNWARSQRIWLAFKARLVTSTAASISKSRFSLLDKRSR